MSFTFSIILFLPIIMGSFSSFQIVSMFLFWSKLLFVFSLKSVTFTGPNIFTSTSWQIFAIHSLSSLYIRGLSQSKPRPRQVIFVLYDIKQFIKYSKCFSSYRKFFPDFLHVEVALVACSWPILNSLISFCACVAEIKLFRSAGKIHSYEKIFPRLTEISVSRRWDFG